MHCFLSRSIIFALVTTSAVVLTEVPDGHAMEPNGTAPAARSAALFRPLQPDRRNRNADPRPRNDRRKPQNHRQKASRSALPHSFRKESGFVLPGDPNHPNPLLSASPERFSNAKDIVTHIWHAYRTRKVGNLPDDDGKLSGESKTAQEARTMTEAYLKRIVQEYQKTLKEIPSVDERRPRQSLNSLAAQHRDLLRNLDRKQTDLADRKEGKPKQDDADPYRSTIKDILKLYRGSEPSAIYTELAFRLVAGGSVVTSTSIGPNVEDPAKVLRTYKKMSQAVASLEKSLPENDESQIAIKRELNESFKKPLNRILKSLMAMPQKGQGLSLIELAEQRASFLEKSDTLLERYTLSTEGAANMMAAAQSAGARFTPRNRKIDRMTLRRLADTPAKSLNSQELATGLIIFAELLGAPEVHQANTNQLNTLGYESAAHPETWLGQSVEWHLRQQMRPDSKRDQNPKSYSLFSIAKPGQDTIGALRAAIGPQTLPNTRQLRNLDIIRYLSALQSSPERYMAGKAQISANRQAWNGLFNYLRKQVRKQVIAPYDSAEPDS